MQIEKKVLSPNQDKIYFEFGKHVVLDVVSALEDSKVNAEDCARIALSTKIIESKYERSYHEGTMLTHKNGNLAIRLFQQNDRCSIRIMDTNSSKRMTIKAFHAEPVDMAWIDAKNMLATLDAFGNIYCFEILQDNTVDLYLRLLREETNKATIPFFDSWSREKANSDDVEFNLICAFENKLEYFAMDRISNAFPTAEVDMKDLDKCYNGFATIEMEDEISAVKFTPNGKEFLVATMDGNISKYDISTSTMAFGQKSKIRVTPNSFVNQFHFLEFVDDYGNNNCLYFAAISDKGTRIGLYNINTFEEVAKFRFFMGDNHSRLVIEKHPSNSDFLIISDIGSKIVYALELVDVNSCNPRFGPLTVIRLSQSVLAFSIIDIAPKESNEFDTTFDEDDTCSESSLPLFSVPQNQEEILVKMIAMTSNVVTLMHIELEKIKCKNHPLKITEIDDSDLFPSDGMDNLMKNLLLNIEESVRDESKDVSLEEVMPPQLAMLFNSAGIENKTPTPSDGNADFNGSVNEFNKFQSEAFAEDTLMSAFNEKLNVDGMSNFFSEMRDDSNRQFLFMEQKIVNLMAQQQAVITNSVIEAVEKSLDRKFAALSQEMFQRCTNLTGQEVDRLSATVIVPKMSEMASSVHEAIVSTIHAKLNDQESTLRDHFAQSLSSPLDEANLDGCFDPQHSCERASTSKSTHSYQFYEDKSLSNVDEIKNALATNQISYVVDMCQTVTSPNPAEFIIEKYNIFEIIKDQRNNLTTKRLLILMEACANQLQTMTEQKLNFIEGILITIEGAVEDINQEYLIRTMNHVVDMIENLSIMHSLIYAKNQKMISMVSHRCNVIIELYGFDN
uniref:Ge1_WD40 domain-containing protein n=1 Tax=Rhabditophanes sp. KR3021 TaxID=114890 RepID=A0AC35TR12_9BILA